MHSARTALLSRLLPAVSLAAFVCLALYFLTPFRLNQLTLVTSYCIALIGLNIVVGLAGQISLAHGAFFAIGAYGTAILVAKGGLPFPLALLGAGFVSMATGFACGLPASNTPATNIISHQSNAPPPPPLGATTVNVAVADAAFAPAGPVVSAFAATVFM